MTTIRSTRWPRPWWRDLSPLGKIPALMDGDRVVNDSSVICQYVERKNPTPVLIPGEDDAYIKAIWLEEFIDAGFVPVAGGKVFFPLIVAPMMAQKPPADDARAVAAKTVADEFPAFWNYLKHAGVDVDAGEWPNLAAFVQRMFERPSISTIIAEEAPVWSLKAA